MDTDRIRGHTATLAMLARFEVAMPFTGVAIFVRSSEISWAAHTGTFGDEIVSTRRNADRLCVGHGGYHLLQRRES